MPRDSTDLPELFGFDPVDFSINQHGRIPSSVNNIFSILKRISYTSFIYDDWLSGSVVGNCQWSNVAANSGTIAVTNATGTNQGVVRLSTAASATAQAALRLGAGVQIMFSGGRVIYEWKVAVSALATVAEDYVLRLGIHDSTTAEPADGVYFKYDRATDGNFWSANTTSNTSNTKTITTLAPTASSTAFVNFLVDVNAAGTQANFYAGNTSESLSLLATHTTNIPTNAANRQAAPNIALIKTAGVGTAITVDIDWYWHFIGYTSPR